MLDDIDALLEEFENKYIQSDSRRNAKSNLEENIDVDEILNIDDDEHKQCSSSANHESLLQCCPVFLGGGTVPKGRTKPGSTRICSTLKCISCDFMVSHFINYEWSDVDYMFLRTHMPSFEKVKEKLRPRKGSSAFACHCTHHTTRTLQALHALKGLQWICKGHPSSNQCQTAH